MGLPGQAGCLPVIEVRGGGAKVSTGGCHGGGERAWRKTLGGVAERLWGGVVAGGGVDWRGVVCWRGRGGDMASEAWVAAVIVALAVA